MKTAILIFPNQLFADHPALTPGAQVILIEEHLFFRQYNFHKQKLVLHRASMKFYQDDLAKKGFAVWYIESHEKLADVRRLLPHLQENGYTELHYCDVADNWLEKRLQSHAGQMQLRTHTSPLFINSQAELARYFNGKRKFFQAAFYLDQRKTRGVLLEKDAVPTGGKWSFDEDNRLKYPKGKTPPTLHFPAANGFYLEAKQYVQQHFAGNYGTLESGFVYPNTHAQSALWLAQFLEQRFAEFGAYEDAIVAREHVLHHSLLSAMLNIGLLLPSDVLAGALEFARVRRVPLNSVEGFVRQILGWREFIHGVYEYAGARARNTNFWQFKRKIPQAFWDGTTGIAPMDITIKKVLATGYCHHIERLMVLGNFMLLCEFDPDEVYRWFMALFIDAFDWVMVPNVYGMSQFADGGLMATKPYLSGSNYLMKMSDYPKGEWQKIWDGLFWRFMDKQRGFFLKNPRLGMLIKTFDRMDESKRRAHLETAESYLAGLK
jgi:deoxyribodipyrimidine photolyase-related protein